VLEAGVKEQGGCMGKRTAIKGLRNLTKRKGWDHDIRYVDGKFVEDVVVEFQKARGKEKKSQILQKIIENFKIFIRKKWAKSMLPYHDNDLESVESVYNEVLWRVAKKYKAKRGYKKKGKSFNALFVSSLINRLRNDKAQKESKRRYPPVECMVCQDPVHQISDKHLRHEIDIVRYKKMYKGYPLVSTDGKTTCPLSGETVASVTREYLNRVAGYYTVDDFECEFSHLLPKFPVVCPVTMAQRHGMSNEYPGTIKAGYTARKFMKDFPDFPGIITSPFNGSRMLEMTQKHLDKQLKQKSQCRYSMIQYRRDFAYAPVFTKRVKVLNPYTGKMVWEITPEMLVASGTTVIGHLHRFTKYHLNQRYQDFMRCPFTGKRTHKITKKYIRKIGKTALDFYAANCKYPLRKWQIQCADCGQWVDNIWEHIEQKVHVYSEPYTMEMYILHFGLASMKHTVTTNAFVVNDEGDQMHLADILIQKKHSGMSEMELEDSLLRGAVDDFDRRLANVVARKTHVVDDIWHFAPVRKKFIVQSNTLKKFKNMRHFIKEKIGTDDFDYSVVPDSKTVEVAIPGKDTVKQTLFRLVKESDLGNNV
jgi:hypothetical protein